MSIAKNVQTLFELVLCSRSDLWSPWIYLRLAATLTRKTATHKTSKLSSEKTLLSELSDLSLSGGKLAFLGSEGGRGAAELPFSPPYTPAELAKPISKISLADVMRRNFYSIDESKLERFLKIKKWVKIKSMVALWKAQIRHFGFALIQQKNVCSETIFVSLRKQRIVKKFFMPSTWGGWVLIFSWHWKRNGVIIRVS